MLKEDPAVRVVETLHNKFAGCMLGESFIDLNFVTKLLSRKIIVAWDFDHNTRADLVNEGHASKRKEMHLLKLASYIHALNVMISGVWKIEH
jgi:hypothetical protein